MVRRILLAGLLALTPPTVPAAQPKQVAVDLAVEDMSLKFLSFYDAATQANADPDRRWALWKQAYDFAAVPPTEDGQKLAREQLDRAWPQYPAAIERIKAGYEGMQPAPETTLSQVMQKLELDKPMKIKLLAYVGMMESKVFTTKNGDTVQVSLPLEDTPEQRAVPMAREIARAVHLTEAGLSASGERSVAELVLTEGLAVRTAQLVVPGKADEAYVEPTSGWLDQARAQRRAIVDGIRPVLKSKKREDAERFTNGKGSAGLVNEARYAGWLAVGVMQKQGKTLAEIARIPEKDMAKAVDEALSKLPK